MSVQRDQGEPGPDALPDDLARLIEAWTGLDPDTRRRILAMATPRPKGRRS